MHAWDESGVLARDEAAPGYDGRIRSLRCQHLIERLRSNIHLNPRLHQLAFHIRDRRRRQGHLQRRHLSRITLTITHQREIVSRHLLAGDYRRFTWRERALYCLGAPIPNLGQLATTQRFGRRVVSANAKQLRRAFQSFRSKLHTHLREILVTRNLKRMLDSDATVYFRWSSIVKNHICSGRCVVTTTAARKLSLLLTGKKRRNHRHCFERRAGNVVRAESSTHERLVAFIRFETNPRCFVVDFVQAVRRFTVHRQHVAVLRIEHDDRAMLSFQKINRSLLQIPIDR